ncbi:hypothetical protein HK097_001976, partial [Rhizophlyctis rosea]
MAPPCHIARVPEHILLQIFEYIQPRHGDRTYYVPSSTKPVTLEVQYLLDGPRPRMILHRPYDQHLAQVCLLWRITAFRLREGNCLKPTVFNSRSSNEGYHIFLADPLRVKAVRVLEMENDPDRIGTAIIHIFARYASFSNLQNVSLMECQEDTISAFERYLGAPLRLRKIHLEEFLTLAAPSNVPSDITIPSLTELCVHSNTIILDFAAFAPRLESLRIVQHPKEAQN